MESKTTHRRASKGDAEVGRRVRARRLELTLSQTALAELTGVTFQQIQKYEKGVNRIGADRLARICKALDVPSSYFFGDGRKTPEADSLLFKLAQDRGAVRLLTAYSKMKPAQRSSVVEMAEQFA